MGVIKSYESGSLLSWNPYIFFGRYSLPWLTHWQISEAWARPISGNLIQNRIFSRKMIFRGVTQTDFLKTHPNMDEFSEIGLAYASIFYKNWIGTNKKWGISFQEIRLCHTPEKWNFGKISGWVFQDLPIRVKR